MKRIFLPLLLIAGLPVLAQKAEAWLTHADRSALFARQPERLPFTRAPGTGPVIDVNEKETFQPTPAGRKVVIVANVSGENQTFTLRSGGKTATATLPKGSVGTYVW